MTVLLVIIIRRGGDREKEAVRGEVEVGEGRRVQEGRRAQVDL